MTDPAPPDLNVILYSPRIPQNVGSVARLCAAMRVRLHVVRPVPFPLDDRALRRAGMDYLDFLDWQVHVDWEACRAALLPESTVWLYTTRGTVPAHSAPIRPGDALLFGNESHGVPDAIHTAIGPARSLRLEMRDPRARSLNLAMSCAMGVYGALGGWGG
ncbi:MAG: tRNA (cytidine(34)-2'-O)-methyltransferase [Sumerlaeia bacterium]